MSMKYAKTKYGCLKGFRNSTYTGFFGIPYAKPPISALRWKAPEEPDGWEGTRDATQFPKRCIQGEPIPGEFYQKEFNEENAYIPLESEDCLYLNIWTPAEKPGKEYPVVMWIHGGGFTAGNGSEIEFDGREYAKRGVILVSINYRLGVFGFFCHPWLKEEAGHSGNYGILDQIQALKWIQENIEAFGGDPDRVTIMGQSAGAISVQTLVTSKLTKGLFRGAIMQSGGGYRTGFAGKMTDSKAEENGKVIAQLLAAESLEQLRAVPAEKLYQAACEAEKNLVGADNGLKFLPVLDGYVLKCGYDEALELRKTADVSYLLGSTSDDFQLAKVGSNEIPALDKGTMQWSLINEKNGRKPAYVYHFERKLPGDDAGAFHSSELWYMFGTLRRCWRPMTVADMELSNRMCDYWTNFIKNGDPNGEKLPKWEACCEKNLYVQKLDIC